MRLYLLMILCLLSPGDLVAQYDAPENRAWAFGRGAGMLFSGGGGVTLITTNQNGGAAGGSNLVEANASVADNSGNLLFYSNGSVVWDRQGNIMPGSANGLHGQGPVHDQWTGSATQGALIVPAPDSPGRYYLFSLTGVDSPHDPYRVGRMYYSVVDMSLNGGMGDIVPGRRWIVLDSLLSEKMIGIRGECNNVWVVVHARDTNAFKAYEITHAGLASTPVISHAGTFDYSPFTTNGIVQNAYHSIGELKASQNGERLVACWGLGGNFAALYDFDIQTGQVSNELKLHSGVSFYGAAFSADNSKVYVANAQTVWQYDLAAANIPGTRTVVGTIANNAASGLRLAPDGKIYFRTNNSLSQIGAIRSPNQLGAACDFVANELIVPAARPGIVTFPNEVPVPNYNGGITQTVKYDTLSCSKAQIRLEATSGFASYVWNDGVTSLRRDVTTPGVYWVQGRFQCDLHIDTFHVFEDTNGYRVQTTVRQDSFPCARPGVSVSGRAGYGAWLWNDGVDSAERFITVPGTYWVRVQSLCERWIDTIVIHQTESMQVNLGADTAICDRRSFVLDAGTYPDARYLWQDGSQQSTLHVTQSGTYHVQVAAGNCRAADTIEIRVTDMRFDLGSDVLMCVGDPIALVLQIPTHDIPDAHINWSTGDQTETLQVSDTGIYWVTVADGACTGSDTVRVQYEMCSCVWYVPDAFTPNGDGRNDVFRAFVQAGCPVSSYRLRIYDRWGSMIFVSADPMVGWDGRINGVPATTGVYMYDLSMTSGTRSKVEYRKGDITLIR